MDWVDVKRAWGITSLVLNTDKHPKCLGYEVNTPNGWDYDCGYNTKLLCEECKYGVGRKDPEAKCNKSIT